MIDTITYLNSLGIRIYINPGEKAEEKSIGDILYLKITENES